MLPIARSFLHQPMTSWKILIDKTCSQLYKEYNDLCVTSVCLDSCCAARTDIEMTSKYRESESKLNYSVRFLEELSRYFDVIRLRRRIKSVTRLTYDAADCYLFRPSFFYFSFVLCARASFTVWGDARYKFEKNK